MGKGTPRHYKLKRNNRAFWEPTTAMRAAGFASIPLGPHGPEAFRLAEIWNDRWDRSRLPGGMADLSPAKLDPGASEDLVAYPKGSLGAAFKEYRQTNEWKRKAPKTRYEWERAWRRIKPIFGDVDPSSVTLSEISAFRTAIEKAVSLREAHRTIKIWRALWKVSAALKYCDRDADPSLGVRNTAAKGRDQTWTEGEVVRLAKRAWRMGFTGLSAVIAIAWDTQLSPGDIRPLTASQMATEGHGRLFFTERGKTGVPVGGLLSARTAALLAAPIATGPRHPQGSSCPPAPLWWPGNRCRTSAHHDGSACIRMWEAVMPQDSKSRKQDQFIVRLPDGMRDRLKDAAKANNRSMNAEIVARLESSGAETMRDRFATAALSRLCSNDDALHRYIPGQMAEWAYQLADAMLAQREKR